MSEFKNRLQRMQEAWVAGKKGAAGVKDGVYSMQLQECELRESNNGKLMIHRVHLIADGEYAGEVIHDNIVLESEYGPRMAAEFCAQMGHEAPEDPAELENIVATISASNPTYTAQVKKSKDSDFRNVRIRQVTSEGNGNGTPAPFKPAPTAKKIAPSKQAKEKEEAPSGLEIGDTVSFDDGAGNVLQGKITTLSTDGVQGDVEVSGQKNEDQNGVYTVALDYLTKVDAPVEAEEEEKGEDITELLAFCQSHDMECDEDSTTEELVEKVNGFAWKEEELTEEEKTLLTGIGTVIEKTKPEPKPKPAPAPAKTTVTAKKTPAKPVASTKRKK